jgi:rhodanese-related sulfurtransferase
VKEGASAVLRCALGIAAVAAAAAVADNSVRRSLPWRGDWENYAETKARALGAKAVTLRGLLDAKDALRLDARSRAAYEAGHIPGALPFPATEMPDAFAELAAELSGARAILVYCDSPACDEALQVLAFLAGTRFANLLYYAGGWEEYVKEKANIGEEAAR